MCPLLYQSHDCFIAQGPLYLVFFLFGKRKDPKVLLQNILRSSLFLTMYTSLGHGSACYVHQISPRRESCQLMKLMKTSH